MFLNNMNFVQAGAAFALFASMGICGSETIAQSETVPPLLERGAGNDVITGVIVPLNIGRERGKFLNATGKDGELDHTEFHANQRHKNGFVRAFDDWEMISQVDWNKNGTIDWFEARDYRAGLKRFLLAEHDKNNDGRFDDAELAAANEAVAAGALRLYFDKYKKIHEASQLRKGNEPQIIPQNNPTIDDKSNQVQSERDIVEKLLANPNLPPYIRGQYEKRLAQIDAKREQRAQSRIEADRNGDQRLDIDEAIEYMKKRVELFRKEGGEVTAFLTTIGPEGNERIVIADDTEMFDENTDPSKQELSLLKRFDRNQNGKLETAEFEELNSYREKRVSRLYDRNKDGVLDASEEEEWKNSEARRYFNMRFIEADRDRNGELDTEEMLLYHKLFVRENSRNTTTKGPKE